MERLPLGTVNSPSQSEKKHALDNRSVASCCHQQGSQLECKSLCKFKLPAFMEVEFYTNNPFFKDSPPTGFHMFKQILISSNQGRGKITINCCWFCWVAAVVAIFRLVVPAVILTCKHKHKQAKGKEQEHRHHHHHRSLLAKSIIPEQHPAVETWSARGGEMRSGWEQSMMCRLPAPQNQCWWRPGSWGGGGMIKIALSANIKWCLHVLAAPPSKCTVGKM